MRIHKAQSHNGSVEVRNLVVILLFIDCVEHLSVRVGGEGSGDCASLSMCSTSSHSLTPPQRVSDKLYRSYLIDGQDNYPHCINKLANHHIAVIIISDRLSMCVGSMRLFPTIPQPAQNSQRAQSQANHTKLQEKKLRLEWGWYQEYCWIIRESQQQRSSNVVHVTCWLCYPWWDSHFITLTLQNVE